MSDKPELLICPSCQSKLASLKTRGLRNDQKIKCDRCLAVVSLRQARALAVQSTLPEPEPVSRQATLNTIASELYELRRAINQSQLRLQLFAKACFALGLISIVAQAVAIALQDEVGTNSAIGGGIGLLLFLFGVSYCFIWPDIKPIQ